MRRATFIPILLLALLATNATAALLHGGHGIHVESAERLDARQIAAHVSTDALQQAVDVRILLPTGYAADPTRSYPVLYLFHGTSGRASDWVVAGDAVDTTAGLPLIAVMPDAGFDGDGGGRFTNWYNGGAGGQPMWETFHVEQLIPWIDDNLRTIPQRNARAVAGLSQGGFGSLSYAARHPDLFSSVAAFSGACVIDGDPDAIAVSTAIIQYTTQVLDGVADPDAMFGPRATNELNWMGHDPGTLVENLRGVQIELWTGDGTAGPFDVLPLDPGASSIETIVFGATERLDRYLTEAGIGHEYHYYGGGTHTWPYWARDLREYMKPLMRRFAHPPDRPRKITFKAAEDDFRAWGWKVQLDRPEPAFANLVHARRFGFALSGTGHASVVTPPYYRDGAIMRVTTRGHGVYRNEEITVGTDDRLRITLPLGDGTTAATTRVGIRPIDAGRSR